MESPNRITNMNIGSQFAIPPFDLKSRMPSPQPYWKNAFIIKDAAPTERRLSRIAFAATTIERNVTSSNRKANVSTNPNTIGTDRFIAVLKSGESAVTGGRAISAGFNTAMKRSVPVVFGFVLTFAFLLLLVTFRSIVVAAKAILLNLLSVGAASLMINAFFQYGWGEGILDFRSNGGIANWLPMFMFVILFGLSMDYHVFILSRIREAF